MSSQIPLNELLERASGQAEAAEVYQLRRVEMPAIFSGGSLESVRSVETAGRALRLVKDGRLGYSTTSDLADGATVVRNALEAAQFGDAAAWRFPAPQPAPEVPGYDEAVERLTAGDLIALGREIVERISAYEGGGMVNVQVRRLREEVRLLNSSGLDVESRRTVLELWVLVERAREGDIFSARGQVLACRREDVDGPALAERMLDRLRWAERIVPVERGDLPVVLRDQAVLCLFYPLLFGLSGREVLQGLSPLGDKLGRRVLDERFTLIDDGRLAFRPYSAPYDDEGTPTAAKPLIKGGVLRQFLYDLKTAAQAGAHPTGNAFKREMFGGGDYQVPPLIDATNWLVRPGERSLEGVLQGMEEALLVERVLGLGQGNVVAGEFSNAIASGYLLRRGEVVGRVKGTMIAGNVYDRLRDGLIALGDEPEWVGGWLHTPAIVLGGVSMVKS
ncbi:MAG: TldD/PmbA family protein [Chloroflexia bacterium]|nr:TldD/PmbA family protein [Chloroflexia bacterium]